MDHISGNKPAAPQGMIGMQPQDSGFDWLHGLTGLGGGALGTLLTWFWRVARIEPTIRAEIKAAEDRVEDKVEERVGEEMGHWRDTLMGLREKINDVEKRAMTRDDFADFRKEMREDDHRFREEYRSDIAELKRNIAEIGARKH